VVLHAGIQRLLPGVAEWRVAQIVRQRHRLDQVLVQSQAPRDRAADLRDFDAVGEAGAEQIALVIDEDLGLVFEAAECTGMDDAVAVALEAVRWAGSYPVPPARLSRLREAKGASRSSSRSSRRSRVLRASIRSIPSGSRSP
jgi:hypothetical protein